MNNQTQRTTVTCIVLLVALVFVVFGQTLNFGFVNFDDDRCVYANPAVIRGSVAWAFTHAVNANWVPITTLSHMLDCQLYGLNPRGHHLTNVLLHAAAAVLLFIALRRLTGATWRSFFVAAVFAVHPLRAESVAWISERKDVLSAFFFMLTLNAYTFYCAGSKRWTAYALTLVAFALGLMSKPMLVTVPIVLLMLDFWPLRRLLTSTKQCLVEKIPFVALSAAAAAVTMLSQKETRSSFELLL
ncbi:MAG: tetratricopeptide repeat protein, partial [Limisphaerales bacterium]